MKTLSRHLPPYRPAPVTWADRAIAFVILAIVAGCSIGYILRQPFYFLAIIAGIGVLIFVFSYWLARFPKTRFEQLMAGRKGENICSFRHAFDLREIDSWIVRATWEEVRETMSTGLGPVDYPIRADDLLEADLLIDPEDVDDIGVRIASRAGYDMTDTRNNPLWGKVKTVGDLVTFFAHQPKTRA